MLRRVSRRAVTLAELVFAIVILGIAVVTMMGALATVSRNAVSAEDTSRLSFFAESLMEDVMGKRFDQNANAPWSALGPDIANGESAANSLTFNDVDDYVNCTDPTVVSPAPGFKRSVSVAYVSLSGSNWVVNANANHPNYKRIIVTANRTNSTVQVILTGIKGAY